MFQIDLNIDLREEPELKRRGCFTICWNMPQCGQICLDMCNFVNMLEYAWNIKCLNKPEF